MNMTSLKDRMKNYEIPYDTRFPEEGFVMVRVDGVKFSKFVKKVANGELYSKKIQNGFSKPLMHLKQTIQGFILAYQISDEISVIMKPEGWYGNRVQKLCSVSASIVTATYNSCFGEPIVVFDARAFSIPSVEEIVNYLIWRQSNGWSNAVTKKYGVLPVKYREYVFDGCKNVDVPEWAMRGSWIRNGRSKNMEVAPFFWKSETFCMKC